MQLYVLLFVVSATFLSSEASLSRSISRSGEGGSVNLIEFNIRGTIYGRCSFFEDGEEHDLLYEEAPGKPFLAKSINPTVVDPGAKALDCRDFATRSPQSSGKLRMGGFGDDSEATESQEELAQRLNYFEEKIKSNQNYIDNLRPRFINMFQNFGLGFGGFGGSSGFGFGLHKETSTQDDKDDNKFPFGITFGGGKWRR